MEKIKESIKYYIKDENAGMEDMIERVVLLGAFSAAAIALGWWIWNKIQTRTEQSSCANNPSPFCVE